MLEIRDFEFGYENSSAKTEGHWTLPKLSLAAGELALITGETGSGKTTFLNAISGIFPNFSGGYLQGQLLLNSKEIHPYANGANPAEIGFVFQNPFDGFVQNTVAAEIEFSNRQLQQPLNESWREQILQTLGISSLWDREIQSLSDGEAQRVAIAAALAPQPQLLILDEPTSALDYKSAKAFQSLIADLRRSINLTVLISEHRFENWLEEANQIWHFENQVVTPYAPAEFALQQSKSLTRRQLLSLVDVNSPAWQMDEIRPILESATLQVVEPRATFKNLEIAIELKNYSQNFEKIAALQDLTLQIPIGHTTAIVGESGAGKSTFLHSLIGDFPKSAIGNLKVFGKDPAKLKARELLSKIALVPQQPGKLFVGESVSQECNFADKWRGLTIGTTLKLLDNFGLRFQLETHPRDLSAGQQLWLAIAIATAANPRLLILDEPTRGLDQHGMCLLQEMLLRRQAAGLNTVWATHDLEAAAAVSDEIGFMQSGKLVSFGPATKTTHPNLREFSRVQEFMPSTEYFSVVQLIENGFGVNND